MALLYCAKSHIEASATLLTDRGRKRQNGELHTKEHCMCEFPLGFVCLHFIQKKERENSMVFLCFMLSFKKRNCRYLKYITYILYYLVLGNLNSHMPMTSIRNTHTCYVFCVIFLDEKTIMDKAISKGTIPSKKSCTTSAGTPVQTLKCDNFSENTHPPFTPK